MKLNFWQWLGVVLLIVGAIIYFRGKTADAPATPPATTQPTP